MDPFDLIHFTCTIYDILDLALKRTVTLCCFVVRSCQAEERAENPQSGLVDAIIEDMHVVGAKVEKTDYWLK